MGYLQALQLMVRAYKAARGVMPKGIDLLKLKMKARQKAIDSNKVVQAADRFDKGNWFRLNKKPAKEGFGKPKKVETEAEMLARMKRQNKESVQRLKEKKKPREDKANGGSPNLPFPFFYEGAIPGGQPRPSLDHYDDDAGVKGLMKRKKKKKKKREDKATGGLTNISETYDANPTLQAQFPNKQDYLDLFSSRTTTTTQPQTYAQMTQQSTAGIPAAKPRIFPLLQDGDDSGNNVIGDGRTMRNQPNYMGGKVPGFTAGLQRAYGDFKTAVQTFGSMISPIQLAKRAKDAYDKAQAKKAAAQLQQIIEEENRRLKARLSQPSRPGGTIDSGNSGGSRGYGGTGGEGRSAVGSSGMLGGGV